jgi:proteasome accessory factor C
VPPAKTVRRLERLLVVVPYIVRHPGTRIDELSGLFGVSQTDLTQDLNLLFMTGLPPYTPADLIDVDIEDGRVWIRMADYFSKPVRLTRNEALALFLRGKALLGTGLPEADALRSALGKIEEHLGPDVLGALRVEVEGGGTPETLEAVRQAASGSDRLEIDYYSASRDETTTRMIDPEQVFAALGNWYAVAWCHRAKAERLFRVDRIRAVRATGERFEPRGLLGAGRPLYARGKEDIHVRLRLGKAAEWVAEYYEVDRAVRRGGKLEVTIPTKDLTWVAKLLLRLGAEAEVLGPKELVDLTRRLADQTLVLYR